MGLSTVMLAAVGQGELVAHPGHGHDDGQVELPLQALLDDLQVQQAQEAAAEAQAQGGGGVLLVDQGGVVQLVFFQGLGQVLVIVRRNRDRWRRRPPASLP